MNSPVVLCETGTLLIRSTRWSIQIQPRRFCRVSYIGLTAATRKLRDTRSLTNRQNEFASFQSRPRKSDVPTNEPFSRM
jgi:uncharacterized protein (DUF111 family)